MSDSAVQWNPKFELRTFEEQTRTNNSFDLLSEFVVDIMLPWTAKFSSNCFLAASISELFD